MPSIRSTMGRSPSKVESIIPRLSRWMEREVEREGCGQWSSVSPPWFGYAYAECQTGQSTVDNRNLLYVEEKDGAAAP